MKLIHLHLKRECVLVELTDTESHPRIIPAMGARRIFYSDQYGLDGLSSIDLDRPVKLIGHFPSITEDQFGELVCIEYHRDASESFLSAIEAEGYTFDLLPKPEYVITQYGVLPEGAKRFRKDYDEWTEAQEKVIDLNRCYVFISDIEAEYKRNVDAYAKERFRK